MMDIHSQIALASRPTGTPTSKNFRVETGPIPAAADGQVLLRTKYLSLDPHMRGRMNDAKSYATPVSIGGIMEGEVVAEVLKSRHPDYCQGDLVQGRIGWRTHAAVEPTDLKRVETGGKPVATALGGLGWPRLTAHSRLQGIWAPRPGESRLW